MKEEFLTLKVKGITHCRRRRVPTTNINEIPKRYSQRIPVSEVKKKDLNDLCDTLVIPERYHHFYRTMPSAKTTRDRLDEPDITEEDQESDEEF